MKKGDIVIIGSVLATFLLSIAVLISFSKQGSHVVIKQDNKIVYDKSVTTDATITLEGNTVEIKNGKVFMCDATCKNQICVNSREISKKGETIVCLPNKVIVEIE